MAQLDSDWPISRESAQNGILLGGLDSATEFRKLREGKGERKAFLRTWGMTRTGQILGEKRNSIRDSCFITDLQLNY